MDEILMSFFTEATAAFQFLERNYGYYRLKNIVEHPDEPRDTTAIIRYISPVVGIDIVWATYNAMITVTFYAFLQPVILPTNEVDSREDFKKAKFANLDILTEMLGKRKDPDFLLKDSDSPRNFYKNAKIIQANMRGVIEGLARATQTYATPILLGDTSLFPQVMQYLREKRKKQGLPDLF